MASSSSPSPPPSPAAAAAAVADVSSPLPSFPPPPPSSSSRRPPPPCWSHDETLALIDSYRDKWNSLRRGNLRASHWQEVADSVALLLPSATPKTSVQCRHKIEKLRKRYRSEKQRSLSSSWIFFKKLDSMEIGSTGPHSSRPSPSAAPIRSSSDDDNDDEDEDPDDLGGNTRSLHRLMTNGRVGGIGGLRFTIPKAVRSKIVGSRVEKRAAPSHSPRGSFLGYGTVRPGEEEMRRKLEKRRRKETGSDPHGKMVNALRMLGDGFMRMEQMKMDMARETEKARMEMELKRTEMILDSQRRIVDAFVKGCFGKKSGKVSSES